MSVNTEERPAGSTGKADTPVTDKAALITSGREALDKVFKVPGLAFKDRLAHAKKMNSALARMEYQQGRSELGCRPAMVELPVAGKCNLRCTMCALSHGDAGHPNWTLAEVKRFEPFFGFATAVNPTGAGEPLSNRDFFSMLELFAGYQLRTGFYTNATLLNEDKIERLVRLGISQVNISIDGSTKETFENIRHHAKFETVVNNTRRLVARRNELGLRLPRLQIAMVLMRENMHELPDLIRLAADLGAESVYTMFASPVVPDKVCELEPARTNTMLREGRRVAEELKLRFMCPDLLPEESLGPGEAVTPAIPAQDCMCSHPWQQFVVWNDGAVSPCCRIRDDVEGEKFGHINDAPPEQLWNSPGFVRLRERLAARQPPLACQVCPIRTSALH